MGKGRGYIFGEQMWFKKWKFEKWGNFGEKNKRILGVKKYVEKMREYWTKKWGNFRLKMREYYAKKLENYRLKNERILIKKCLQKMGKFYGEKIREFYGKKLGDFMEKKLRNFKATNMLENLRKTVMNFETKS
jgi:hypothetical protein